MVEIVVPVYNEGANILRSLTLINQQVKHPFKVSVVYDFDGDTTLAALQSEAGLKLGVDFKSNGSLLQLKKNNFGRGALNAIKSGLLTSDCDYVIVTMADLSDPPAVINHMLDKAKTEACDIVCGSRYMRGGSQVGGPFIKRTLSRWAGLSLKRIINFPTHDVTNSFKLYKKQIFNQITIESSGGFELGMEIVVKAWILGLRVAEVPTSWQDRSDGQSNFKLWQWIPHYLKWWFMAFRFKLSPRTWFNRTA